MPLALDAATFVHSKQVDATIKAQDLIVRATQTISDAVTTLRAKAPQVPSSVSAPLGAVTAPVTKALGTPSDFSSHFARSAHDWVSVQHRFQVAALETVLPTTPASDRIRSAN